jgi:hypothetical protein
MEEVQVMELTIDPRFKSLIPPLSAEELAQLESNIVADGCRDPLVVWNGYGILVDGHNRHERSATGAGFPSRRYRSISLMKTPQRYGSSATNSAGAT